MNTPVQAAHLHAEALRLHQAGRLAEAETLYRQALALAPRNPDSLNLLAMVLIQRGMPAEAIEFARSAVALDKRQAFYLVNLGLALQGSGELDEAAQAYRRALVLEPDAAMTLGNLGNTFRELGRLEDAARCLRKAIALQPALADFHSNLGAVLQEMGQYQDAQATLETALRLDPRNASAWINLGNVFYKQERLDDAINTYRHGLGVRQDPKSLRSLLNCLHYSERTDNQEIARTARAIAGFMPRPTPGQGFENQRDPERRLRIGYVSPDFRSHPVGAFLEGILESHDAAQVEIFCYSNTAFRDHVTDRLQALVPQWRQIEAMSDSEVIDVIRQDGIDILIDLAGHSDNGRLPVFAMRAAPVQVAWMGYWGSTGLATMDHVLVDRMLVHPGDEPDYTENIWRLPGCYLCYRPMDPPIASGPFPAAANGFVTFGSFNKRIKVSNGTVAAWARILKRTADSRLLLKAAAFDSMANRQQVEALFAAQGIEKERLTLEGLGSVIDSLAAYNRVDIALDTFPYSGATTTANALWMGVPVITLDGGRWAGRMSQSILAAAALDDWIAPDLEAYVDLACRLAAELPPQDGWRAQLRRQVEQSSLCDHDRFTRGLEDAFRQMWRIWCARPPAA